MIRSLSCWVGLALVFVISGLGLQSAVSALDSLESPGQRVTTAAQFGYALAGLVASGALLGRRPWVRRLLWGWVGLVALTAGMAPVVWAGAGVGSGLATGAASAAVAALVAWMATR